MVRTHRHVAAAQPSRDVRMPTDAERGPALFVAAARSNPMALRCADMVAAQRAVGNQALSDLLAPLGGRDEVRIGAQSASFTLRAEIPFGNGTQKHTAAPEGAAAAASFDSVTGNGQTVEITEDEPGSVQLSMSDAISGSLTFTTAISRGNPKLGADDFGLTSWSAKLVDPVVTPDPAKKVFAVTGKIDAPIGWEIHSLGKKAVLDENSPNIKRSTWRRAAFDLTPDMSDDNGRPPRDDFWAPDLTEQHEKFHAAEFQTYGKAAFDLATEWLQKQTASSDADALTVAKRVPNEMIATVRATYVPMAESRAYGDGAASYKARAEAITKAGRANSYPA
jgi:hypothetical protein